MSTPTNYKVIGTRPIRHDGVEKVTGRALYGADLTLAGLLHGRVLRSPHAHARIVRIDSSKALALPGVVAVVTGAELAKTMTPWVGVLTHLKGIKSAPQSPIAVDRACWQGEAVCAVVARTRAQAEDACELIDIVYEELPAVTNPETALDASTPVIHASLGDNLCFERKLDVGEVDKAFANSDAVVEATSSPAATPASAPKAARSSPTGTPVNSA